MDQLEQLKANLEKFVKERDWEQFHSPKNVAMALSVEAGEVVEIFQWLSEQESYALEDKELNKLKEELGDVFLYLQLLASKYDIDLVEAARNKMQKNDQKYPANKAKGSAKKYTDL